jgi:hypothetical protein
MLSQPHAMLSQPHAMLSQPHAMLSQPHARASLSAAVVHSAAEWSMTGPVTTSHGFTTCQSAASCSLQPQQVAGHFARRPDSHSGAAYAETAAASMAHSHAAKRMCIDMSLCICHFQDACFVGLSPRFNHTYIWMQHQHIY